MSHENQLSRRTVLGGIVSTAAMPVLAAKTFASPAEPTLAEPIAQRAVLASADPVPRIQHAVAVLPDGRVLVTGGYVGGHLGQATNSVQIHDPRSDTWANVAPMLSPRSRHSAVLLPDGRVAVVGGYSSAPLDSIEIYDPASDTWAVGPSLPMPMCDHTAVISSGSLVLHGGANGVRSQILDLSPVSSIKRP